MTDTFIRYWVYGTIGVIAFVLGIIVMQLSRSDDVGSRGISGADSCNVALIRAQGQLYTYTWLAPAGSEENSGNSPGLAISAEDIVRQISNANQDPAIEAVVLQVDSTGGSVVAGEEIANELRRVSKPSVALIRAEGLSAAYWAASGAKTIFASGNSEVGHIGVTASYVDQARFNEREGYTFHTLSTGKYKDIFNTSKPLPEYERVEIMAGLRVMMDNFIKAISVNRNIPEDAIGDDIRSATVFTGPEAIEAKLVDYIGDREDVRAFLAKGLGKDPADITFCDY
ncbi:MAG: hypothetical protein A3I44_03640 [Candidatus Sungbacteria bacterium RIFCSPLOWO2_02_FULL_51_17]|nr:MAG: hypothetical protein A2676_03420 [Candidatus Sungbacteria bacterium RIFCSPHIGHO2_01_FULL_51_22]OHA10480.1 MAG: hypothetical protein A3I44_03640 [Candidatus Sungbacteria bacterium RIFCSPLOWO2_02_FULL_51_17]